MKLQRELGVTSVVVSHDIRSVFRMASKVALLNDHRVTFFGTPEEMTASEDHVHPRLPGRAVVMKRSSFITWDQLKVGGIILAALAVLAVAIYKLGQAANLFSKRYELVAFLPNANGLRAGGTVFVAGQFAGTIQVDRFPSGRQRHDEEPARSRMAIDAALQEQIRGDSKAKVRTMGLLGDKVIDISIGTPRHGALQLGRHDRRVAVAGLRSGPRAGGGRGRRHGRSDARHAQDHGRHRRRARARSAS